MFALQLLLNGIQSALTQFGLVLLQGQLAELQPEIQLLSLAEHQAAHAQDFLPDHETPGVAHQPVTPNLLEVGDAALERRLHAGYMLGQFVLLIGDYPLETLDAYDFFKLK